MIDEEKIMTMENKCDFHRDFSSKVSSEYNIWECYHNSKLIDQYNLVEDENKTLFNTSNVGYVGLSLNHLNRFLSEGACLVYPWLNGIKSEYIGFKHYRRFINTDKDCIDFDKIANGYTQYFHSHLPNNELENTGVKPTTIFTNIENHCLFWSMVDCGIMDDLIEYLYKYHPELMRSEMQLHNFIWASMFITNWKTYCKIADLIYGYISFINKKYELDWDEEKWYQHVHDKFIMQEKFHNSNDQDKIFGNYQFCSNDSIDYDKYTGYEGYVGIISHVNLWRVYSYNIEFLVSIFIYNNKNFLDENNMMCFVTENKFMYLMSQCY